MFWLIRRGIKIAVNKTLIAKTILAMAIVVAFMYPLTSSFIKASAISLLYFPLLLALGVFTKADLHELLSLKKSPKLPGEIESWYYFFRDRE